MTRFSARMNLLTQWKYPNGKIFAEETIHLIITKEKQYIHCINLNRHKKQK